MAGVRLKVLAVGPLAYRYYDTIMKEGNILTAQQLENVRYFQSNLIIIIIIMTFT